MSNEEDETAEERAEALHKALENHDNQKAQNRINKIKEWAAKNQRRS